jgi:pyruvate,water dikinase
MNHLLRLGSDATRGRVGGKGANLARLIEKGFRVPEARAVSVAAFDEHVAACRQAGAVGDRALVDAIVARPVDPDLVAAMRAFVDEVGGRVSVRSSATLEDAHTHAFAGQFLTVLNVGADGVEDAVRRVWASAFTEHVAAYLERGGLDAGALRMAVVLQQQIDSQASGVVLGDAGRAMIETVFGQGEAVVSAEIETDHWDLQSGRVVASRIARKGWRVGIPEGPPNGALARFELPEEMRERPSLSPEQVLQVAQLAGRLSRSFEERPQDCEFSFADDTLFVLQTRDVTASLPIEPPPIGAWAPPGEGSWELDVSHFTRPVTRLFEDRFPPAIVTGFERGCARYGTLISYLEVRMVNRFAFSRVCPVDESELGARFETAGKVWRNREWRRQAAEWEGDKRTAIERHLALQRVDLAALDDAALIEHLRAVDDHVGRMIVQHHAYNMAALIPTGDLLAHVARWSEGRVSHAEVLALLAGASSVSADLRSPDARRLAKSIAGSEAARRLLRLDEDDAAPDDLEAAQALEALCDLDEEAGRHAREFLEHREYRLSEGLDPAAPTLREMPAVLWRAVRDCARYALETEPSDPGYPALLARCREVIPEEHRETFDGLLEEARATYHLRDERALYSDVWAWGILRSVCLEVGARLLRREEPRVVEPADALQASVDELASLLLDGEGPSVLELEQRGAYQRAYTTDDAPATLGPAPDPPPPLETLPPDVGRLMGAVMTVIGVTLAGRGEKPPSDAKVLNGHAASGGVYEGPAHVIASPRDVESMPRGAVLVVGASSSAFTMLAPLASAVIAEGGGLLSHVAIVCREYRIPCVVGCTGALERVTTGRRVRVDGTHGTVALADDV